MKKVLAPVLRARGLAWLFTAKALAWLDMFTLEDAKRLVRRPGFWLGFLFFFDLAALLSFIVWHRFFPNWWVLGFDAPLHGGGNVQAWVTVIAAAFAVLGWVVSSWVALRNSIKQHTINTLLQSRLSTAYDSYAKSVSHHFSGPSGGLRPLTEEQLDDEQCREKIQVVRYLLNYLEFVAIGIRNGDLDEQVLKSSLRSILQGQYKIGRVYIERQRKDSERIYENFLWLHARWGK